MVGVWASRTPRLRPVQMTGARPSGAVKAANKYQDINGHEANPNIICFGMTAFAQKALTMENAADSAHL